MTSTPPTQPLQIGSAQIRLQNLWLRDDLTLDDVHLDGGDIRLELPARDTPARISTGETRFRATMSEPNLNRFLSANLPPDAPVRNLRVEVLSGKLRFAGNFVKIISIPLTLEAVPRVENGVRVFLDWQGMKTGVKLPSIVVEMLEQRLGKTLDLALSPIPIWLDEIRCEPGRVTAIGKARIVWPPVRVLPGIAEGDEGVKG